jgi:hypothetical protein
MNLFVAADAPALPMFPGFGHVSHSGGQPFSLVKFRDFDAMPPAIAGDYYGLFSLKRTLCGRGQLPHTLTLASQDRFTLTADIGDVFTADAHFRCVGTGALAGPDLTALAQPRQGYHWLVGQPYFFEAEQTLLEHYAACHHVQDLMRFCADAVDTCLGPQFVTSFLKTRFMFRSPAVGSFETAPFFKMLDILECIALQFVKSGWVQRTGYQAGSLGFLLERLHSFLLTVQLEEMGLLNDPAIYGQQTIYLPEPPVN